MQQLEGAASRGGEQIDDGLDRFVGMVIGRFEPAVGSVLGLGLIGEGSAQPFMKEEKEQPRCQETQYASSRVQLERRVAGSSERFRCREKVIPVTLPPCS